ncbi:RPII140-upstream gene protein [Bactrocera neohumeralis]|uniref:RPII140-upstream gene protein n=1 Tax=Bactrocera neohumeralis TaxID=98809 RepID=UPI0021654A18|nr:RPII140-upstream gene protein [Bactrocera neohumeralis]
MNFIRNGRRILLAGILPSLPGDPTQNDIVSKDTKTYKAYLQSKPDLNESGLDRLKDMFQVDEFGSISSELNSIYQAGFVGFLFGAIYGGVIQSRAAYLNFMESNQATAFKSHLDAKRKLQDEVTMSFARGGFKWGWRVGLFTTSYFGIITCVSVYRGKSSIFEYIGAGFVTGSLYKINLGLRGMAAGGIIGGVLGSIAGAASLALLYASGTSMEEIRYWQYKWRLERENMVHEAMKKQEDDAYQKPGIFKEHDVKVGDKITLDPIK